jgi:hypothetical protein
MANNTIGRRQANPPGDMQLAVSHAAILWRPPTFEHLEGIKLASAICSQFYPLLSSSPILGDLVQNQFEEYRMVRWMIFTLMCACVGGVGTEATAAPAVPIPPIPWEKSDEGETAFVPMKSAPYPHPSRENGYTYKNVMFPREPHYADSTVGLFIPRTFSPRPKVNLLVYLHGWGNNVRKAISEYKLREQIVASGQNIILVFPEGPRDASDSGCGKLEDKDGLRHLVIESLAALHSAGKIDHEKLGHVLIAGHSGAYKGLACCADHGGLDGELTGVCLLDSSYGNLDMFVTWVLKHPQGRFFSIFTDHLAAENVYLFTHIQKPGEHCTLYIDSDANDTLLTRSRTLFLHTETLKHDETVRWLERWLRTRKLG